MTAYYSLEYDLSMAFRSGEKKDEEDEKITVWVLGKVCGGRVLMTATFVIRFLN